MEGNAHHDTDALPSIDKFSYQLSCWINMPYKNILNLLFEVFIHIGSGFPSVAHSQDDGSTAAHNVAAGKERGNTGLHLIADGNRTLATQFQALD